MKLKELRKKFSISQSDLATIANTTQRCISSYENGTAEPGISTLKIFADYFHITIDELVGHEVPYLIDKSLLSNAQLELIDMITSMTDEECRFLTAYAMGIKKGIEERNEKFKRG